MKHNKTRITFNKLNSFGLIVVMVTLFTFPLTSCNNKEQVNYTTEASEAIIETGIEADIPDHISYQLVGEGGTVVVDADIILPENYDKCSVVEYSKIHFTDEDVRAITEQVFDKDSYFLYMPYSQTQIENLQDRLKSIYDTTSDQREKNTLQNELLILDDRLNNLSPVYEDMGEIEALKLYTIPPENEWYPEQERCCLIGTIDGKYYYLLFSQESGNGNVMMKLQPLRDINKYETNINLGPDSLDVQLEENSCAYSLEEAKELATEYVIEFGYTDYQVIATFDSKENNYGAGSDIRKMNSYNIYFGRRIDGYSMTYCTSNFPSFVNDSVMTDGIIGEGYPSEFIKVNVSDEGVTELMVFNPMKEEQVLDNHAKLLAFEDIDSIAREEMLSYIDNKPEDMQQMTVNISEIELGYGYTYDEKTDRYALIPVWFYIVDENNNTSNYRRYDGFNYNAMDGTWKDHTGIKGYLY